MELARTKETAVAVREAKASDVPVITAIYNFEVASAHNHYESEPQRVEDRLAWLEGLQRRGYPVLVAEADGEVAGFAALTPFHPLSGYRFTVSGSIYVKAGRRGAGVGRALAAELHRQAVERNFHCILAGVNSENTASIQLLQSFGFEKVGYFKHIGFKNGRWHDDVCLQLLLSNEEERS